MPGGPAWFLFAIARGTACSTFFFLPKNMRSNRFDILFCVLIAVLCLVVFGGAVSYGFLGNWDDGVFVVENTELALTWHNFLRYLLHPFQDLWTPLPMYSLMLDRALVGLSPAWYHLHNILLHTICALLLYAILRKLECAPWLALIGALLWMLNPQKVESVAWITERKDVLCGALAFGAVLAFLHERSYCAAILSFLAIAAKPAAIALPGMFLVIWWMRRAPLRDWRRYVIPSLGGVLAFVVSAVITAQTNPGKLEKMVAVPIHNLFWYPLTALVPFEVNPIYPEVIPLDARFWGVVVGGAMLTLVGCLLVHYLGYGGRQYFGMLLLIGGNILPVLGLLHYTNFRYCDRYNYLVSAVVITAVALLAARLQPLMRRAWILPSVGVVLAAFFAVLSLQYLPNWSNCRYISLYAIESAGKPNRKAVEMALYVAFAEDNFGMLDYVKKALRERPMYDEGLKYVNPNLLRLIDAHSAMRRKDYATAKAKYQEIFATVVNGELHLAVNFFPTVYGDAAILAELEGDHARAAFYRKQAEK